MRADSRAVPTARPTPTPSRAPVDARPATPGFRPEATAPSKPVGTMAPPAELQPNRRPFDPRDAMPARPRGADGVDHRFHRPRVPQHHPSSTEPPPVNNHYHNYYSGYYCHPWYRNVYWTRASVWFGFG